MKNKSEYGIVLKIDGDIKNISDSLKALQQGFDSIEMPDKMGKGLEKDITKILDKIKEFEKRSQSTVDSLSDAKEIKSLWKDIAKDLDHLDTKLGGIDASKIFPKDVIKNLEKATSEAKKYTDALENSKNSSNYQAKLAQLDDTVKKQQETQKLLNKAKTKESQLQADFEAKKAQWSQQDEQNYQTQQAEIKRTTQEYNTQLAVLRALQEEKKKLQVEGYVSSSSGVGTVARNKKMQALADAETEEKSAKRSASSYAGKVSSYEKAHAGQDLSKDQKYQALKKKQVEAENKHKAILTQIITLKKEIGDLDKAKRANTISQDIADAEALSKSLKSQADAAEKAGESLGKTKKEIDSAEDAYNKAAQGSSVYEAQVKKLEQDQADLNDELKQIQLQSVTNEWNDLVTAIKETTGIDLSGVAQDMEEVEKAIASYENNAIQNLPDTLKKILENALPIPEAIENIEEGLEEAAEDAEKLSDAEKEVQNLKKQLLDFFSLTNSIQLFRRAIDKALATIKELDATMTEAAVVTEFDVGDMWEKLPEYSKNAQALGVSINSMYQATTLYYQQGLKSNAAMQLGVETMKMAKIAGMDSTNATKAMTAALRGFNMELNEMSATKVNDVYSQLAAVTAADTNQIATAMEKTASIAASANMEFETTAALLAQIIETTQEAPETAGTAMKTIIARFAEVKSLREQGLTSGEDEEGEAIDVNKIQTALRSVGISMEGFFSGTEGLDSVLLKLAEKWGTLNFETQRYIATMAAGSRQQSRFIAMMSDYARTTELVGEAQNSAGASQRQFEKTQESLATSLTRLKNAWDEFLMGLTNDGVIKFAVDFLTKILETINKITNAISGGNGLSKSLVSLFGVIGALKGGRALFDSSGVNNLLGSFTGNGSYTETITHSKDKNGNLVKTVVRNPNKQGQDAGIEAGNGFVAGFVKAIKANKNGQTGAKAFMSNLFGRQMLSPKKFIDNIKRIETIVPPEQQSEIKSIYTELESGNITVSEASQKLKELKVDVNELNKDSQVTTVNMKAVGQAIIGVGAVAGLLASAFEEMGMEDAAEKTRWVSTAIIGLGTAFTILSPVIEIVGQKLVEKGIEAAGAWWWITLIVVAVTATLVGVIAIFKAINNNSIEGRMKKAEEATASAKSAAEEAKQAYEQLLSDHSEYDELQNKLEDLTKGTKEWKDALIETNDQVLELISKYPELSEFLNISKDGQITLTDEGWETVENKKYEDSAKARTIAIMSQAKVSRLKKESVDESAITSMEEQLTGRKLSIETAIDDKKAETIQAIIYNDDLTHEAQIAQIAKALSTTQREAKKIKDSWDNEASRKTTYQQVEKFSKEELGIIRDYFASNPDLFGNEDKKRELFTKVNGLTEEALEEFKESLINYSAQINGIAAEQLAANKSMIISALSPEDAGRQGVQVAAAYSAGMVGKNRDGKKDNKYGEGDSLLYGNGALTARNVKKAAKQDGANNWFDKMAADLGVTSTGSGISKIKEMKAVYEKVKGEGAAKDLTRKELKEWIAEYANNQYAIEQTKQMADKFESRTQEEQTIEAAVLSGDISGLKQSDLNEFISLGDAVGEIAAKGFNEITEAYGIVKDSEQYKQLEANYNLAKYYAEQEQEKYAILNNQAGHYDAQNLNQYKNATTSELQSYVELLKQSTVIGNKEEIEEGLSYLFETYGPEKSAEIRALMADFDWDQENAGENFLSSLEGIGLVLDENDPKMKKFISNIKKLDALTRDYDVSKVLNSVTDGLKEAQEVAKKTELTNEEYSKYLSSGDIKSEDWVFTGTGWKNIEGGMQDLVDALKENTLSNYKEEIDEAKKYIDWYEYKQGLINEAEMFQDGGLSTQEILGLVDVTPEEYAEIKNGYKYEQAKSIAALESQFDPSKVIINTEEEKNEDYEKYYNAYESLATLAREREKLEKKRNKLLEEGNADQAFANQEALKDSLLQEKQDYEALRKNKWQQIQDLLNSSSIADETLFDVAEDGTITFDVDAANALTGEDRKAFDELKNNAESLRNQMREAEDNIFDIDIKLEDIEDEERETYINFTNKAKDALIKSRQKEIDELKEINDSINDTNGKILESMQQQIQQDRQNRDNEKAEQEIAEKQRRLAYLQQDSSSANALEIMNLQKEIEESQESYTDQLIDQKISELQRQNDEAAEQRAEQISIMEAQKEIWESGAIYTEIANLINGAFVGGQVDANSDLIAILKEAAGFDAMSKEEQEKFMKETVAAIAGAYGLTIQYEDGELSIVPKTQYKQGGLADFTGPAWLDGTKSKPEYVLNAAQTEGFFTLVDVLSGLKAGSAQNTQNSGEYNYDIDINVESIGSDYDVEQISRKVEELIVESSRYRNNNVL